MMTNSLSCPHDAGIHSVLDVGPPRHDMARVLAAGAMTFLLSGDLRLAMRATRLLIEDDHASRRIHARSPQAHRRRIGKPERTEL